MEYIIVISIYVISLILLALILKINLKKVKELAEDEELKNIVDKFPDDIEVCKSILKQLGNENVTIKKDEEYSSSLYTVFNNSITIGKIKGGYVRLQTIAHECVHSIQDKRLLWFNFIFSNLYILYSIIISILTIMGIIGNPIIHIVLLTLFGFIQYFIRSMLEIEAMTKAKYVAKEYMESTDICTKDEINKLINKYEEINNIGIKAVCYQLFINVNIKVVTYTIICYLCK